MLQGVLKQWGKNLCRNAWFGGNFAMASIQVDVLITVSINTEVVETLCPSPNIAVFIDDAVLY